MKSVYFKIVIFSVIKVHADHIFRYSSSEETETVSCYKKEPPIVDLDEIYEGYCMDHHGKNIEYIQKIFATYLDYKYFNGSDVTSCCGCFRFLILFHLII